LPAVLRGATQPAEQTNSFDFLLISRMFPVLAERAVCPRFASAFCSPSIPDRQGTTVQIFSQAKDETVVINGEVNVTVVDILGDEVVLAIDAPERAKSAQREPW
jgi:hypothetical protein